MSYLPCPGHHCTCDFEWFGGMDGKTWQESNGEQLGFSIATHGGSCLTRCSWRANSSVCAGSCLSNWDAEGARRNLVCWLTLAYIRPNLGPLLVEHDGQVKASQVWDLSHQVTTCEDSTRKRSMFISDPTEMSNPASRQVVFNFWTRWVANKICHLQFLPPHNL